MIAEGIREILELAKPEPVVVDGRNYSTGDLMRVTDPEPATVPIHTLSGIADLIAFDRLKDVAVHIADGKTVRLVSTLHGGFRQRDEFAKAVAITTDFRFNSWMGHEEFMVALQTQFVGDDERKKVLAFVGSIADGKTIRTEDDGVTQRVELKAGVTMKTEGAVPNPVTLAPWRTFPEVTQPESLFVLRVKSGRGEEPATCGLFSADADSWQKDAIEKIAAWFTENLPGVPVIR